MNESGWIGRYRIEGELGRGGMGVVYRALDPELDRPVAIKLIRLPPDASHELRDELEKRFRREAKAAARIRHPGVVAIHDVGVMESGLYLVMELVDGESLGHRLERLEFPGRDSALELVAQAADALSAAHRAGVVHRDVKPANILLSADGRVMLTDFGVARSLDEVSELTRTGMVVGSPAYMAPEQLQGAPVDGRADLFSLGVVLYELLLRKRPFPAQSITTLLYQILHEDPLADPGLARELDAETAGVLRRLLAKQPAERFADAATTAAALRSLPPAKTRPADEAPTLPRWVPPSPGPPLPTVDHGTPGRSPVATDPGSFAALPRAGRSLWPWLLGAGLAAGLLALVAIGVLLAWRQGRPQRPALEPRGPVATWDPAAAVLPEPSYAVTGTPAPVASPIGSTATGVPLATPPPAPTVTQPMRAETPLPVEPAPATAPPATALPPPAYTPPPPVAPAPAPPPEAAIDEDYRFAATRAFEMEIDPEEAEVWVDGRSYGPAQRWDGRPSLELPPGRHRVALRHPDYHPRVIELTVSPDAEDEVTEVEVELEEREEP